MDFQPLIQGFIVVIVIGVVYSLWRTTKAYGGLMGAALKWIGLGMVFFSLEALDRSLGNLSFVSLVSAFDPDLLHNGLLLFGLLFCGIGFSKLMKIAK